MTAIFATFVLGCPDPQSDVEFLTDGKYSKSLVLSLGEQPPLELKIEGNQRLSTLGYYTLTLYVDVRRDSSLERVSLSPDRIITWFENVEMQPSRVYLPDFEWSDQLKTFRLSYSCDPSDVEFRFDADGNPEDAVLRIVMNDFISVDGRLVPVDTIFGLNRQVSRLGDKIKSFQAK